MRRSVISRYRPCVADDEAVVVETRSSEAGPAAGRSVRRTSDGSVVLSGAFDATTHDIVRVGLADSVTRPSGYQHVETGVPDRCGPRQVDEEQLLIDSEVGNTRREILADLGHVLRDEPQALAAQDFLTVADEPLILDAILLAATAVGAGGCDLKLYDPDACSLRLVRHRGLPAAFLDLVADAATPSACGTAMTTGQPVIIDDIAISRVFAGQPTLPVMLAAGFRAVQSFPLHGWAGELAGVLSFHYTDPRPLSRAAEQVARAAATALSELTRR